MGGKGEGKIGRLNSFFILFLGPVYYPTPRVKVFLFYLALIYTDYLEFAIVR